MDVQQAVERYRQAADLATEACRLLEQAGVDEAPIERFYQAMDALTRHVNRLVPPPGLRPLEPADAARPVCSHPPEESRH